MSSRFLSAATAAISPYTPGEQPRDKRYIKLNTNECPYPPSPGVAAVLRDCDSGDLRLYPDPDNTEFCRALADYYGLTPDQVLVCGGSDEALAFAFMAFFDRGDRVYFADITYGFYPVYADLFQLEQVVVPLRGDYSLAPEDYFNAGGGIFIANPNAPTGMAVTPEQIEAILKSNPDRLVVIDEAYCDFAPEYSCMGLISQYDNLLVVRTFSKSRALAGMRLGAAFGNAALIEGMNRIKYSFNPYNLDRVSQAVGVAAIRDRAYFDGLVAKVVATRERAADELRGFGFTVLPSQSNFLFARHPNHTGWELYHGLRQRGVLVRYFNKPRIDAFVRVTVGTDAQMDAMIAHIAGLLGKERAG